MTQQKLTNLAAGKKKTMQQAVGEANEQILKSLQGKIRPLRTIQAFDDKLGGVFPSDFVCIAARPGMGKSALMNVILRNIFTRPENSVIPLVGDYCTFEMPAYQQILRWYAHDLSIESKRFRNFYDKISDEEFQKAKQVGEDLKKLNIYFQEVPVKPEHWYTNCLRVQEQNIQCTPIYVLDHTRLALSKGSESEMQKISELAFYANRLKNEQQAIIFFISQMNRDIEKEKDRRRIGQSPPVLADIFGASAIEQYATLVLALHRPSEYGVDKYLNMPTQGKIFTHVLKAREGWTGVIVLNENLKYYQIYGDAAA